MNNKGQVLVIFVILLPIFLMILAFIIDIGLLSIEKRRIDNNAYDAVEYYLDNSDKEKTTKLLEDNLNDIEININDNGDYVEITVIKDYKGLYTIISNDREINITYKGIKETKEIIKG